MYNNKTECSDILFNRNKHVTREQLTLLDVCVLYVSKIILSCRVDIVPGNVTVTLLLIFGIAV